MTSAAFAALARVRPLVGDWFADRLVVREDGSFVCSRCGAPIDPVEEQSDICYPCEIALNNAQEPGAYDDEPDPNVYCTRCGCAQHPAEIMDLNGAPACESCVESVPGPLSGTWSAVPF